MNNFSSISVKLPNNPYEIHIGQGALNNFKTFIPPEYKSHRQFFICDSHTEIYARKIAGDSPLFVVHPGEAAKSFTVYQSVMSFLLDHKINRNSLVIAVGGGVVGDLAGFAAASALRGVPYIQIPTSLLAMVDSSVGGKTGINAPQGKNLIGAFHQPCAVICDIDVLRTLPEREMKAGYAEILKYGLLGDAEFFEWLDENAASILTLDPKITSYAIQRSCEMKAEIVITDEKETLGQRALLNLGHTFAHAFEAVMKYDGRLLHGEAVAVGMICAMELSAKLGLMNPQNIERVVQHMGRLGLKKSISDIGLGQSITADNLLEIMRGDKKASSGQIRFILMKDIGKAYMDNEVNEDDVIALLSNMMG